MATDSGTDNGRIRGGRRAAELALRRIHPESYARSRNFLDGDVSRLSPYLRHGVLHLAEVRDHALQVVRRAEEAEKFISELGWRDYWQRLYAVLGDDVWLDREPYKTGWGADEYAEELPAEVIAGATGLACMDGFSSEMRTTGYLHNHARMWFAAWVVHWLHVRWQAGARWFLTELLDADVASNHLSWQWVASTFASKAYFFNRENLERYTSGKYCSQCEARDRCPFDATYEELEMKLFRKLHMLDGTMPPTPRPIPRSAPKRLKNSAVTPVLLWVHTGALTPTAEIFTQHPEAPSCFVWDEAWLAAEQPSSNRIRFIEECLVEMPASMTTRRGNLAEEVLAAARSTGASAVAAMATIDPGLLKAAETIQREMPVAWVDGPEFVQIESVDLKRFSRYWTRVKDQAMRPPHLSKT